MPSNYIEGREFLLCSKKFPTKFLYNNVVWTVTIFEPCCGNKKIPWSSKTISSYMYSKLHSHCLQVMKTLNIVAKITWFEFYKQLFYTSYIYCWQLEQKVDEDIRCTYLLVQDQGVENGCRKPQPHSHVKGHQADQLQNEILEVIQQFHREKFAIFRIR